MILARRFINQLSLSSSYSTAFIPSKYRYSPLFTNYNTKLSDSINITINKASSVNKYSPSSTSSPSLSSLFNLRRMSTSTTSTSNSSTSASISSTNKENEHPYTNRLIHERSPYLLQHAHNPVDWYPWCQEAFDEAKKHDKLIFLSVGYSTCHWCHVMERESFENPDIANIMNELFISIKVDKEERPDIDKLYMTYITEVFGHGGWPMSVWLTPDLTPLTGGTYFSSKPAYGKPGFGDLCKKIAKIWKTDREMAASRGSSFVEYLKESKPKGDNSIALSDATIKKCTESIIKQFDSVYGGFSSAPKFPRCSVYNQLNVCGGKDELEKLHFTLVKMAFGGIYDHLGGGFHRYSVTEDWRVPHFEKMLYDQGQIANVYIDAYLHTKKPLFRKIVYDTLSYVQRDLTDSQGGLYCAEDADSLNQQTNEKQEGAFYVWTYEEIQKLLESDIDTQVFTYMFDVLSNGNVNPQSDPHGELTGKNILHKVHTTDETARKFGQTSAQIEESVERSKKILYEHRTKNRPRPHLDDKIITAWNGLMISAFARAYQVFGEKEFLESAKKAVDFIRTNLYHESDQILIRNYRQGPSKVEGFSDDYSYLIQSLLDLYEASFDESYLRWALQLQKKQIQLFWDDKEGGFFTTNGRDSTILSRQKEEHDGAEPSPQSVSSSNLIRLSNMLHYDEFEERAQKTMEGSSIYLEKAPLVMPQMVCALKHLIHPFYQITVLGSLNPSSKHFKATQEIINVIHQKPITNRVLLFVDVDTNFDQSIFKEVDPNSTISKYQLLYDQPTVYVCSNEEGCYAPVNTIDLLNNQLDKLK